MSSPCQKGLAGRCESAIQSFHLAPSLCPPLFLRLPSATVELSPRNLYYGQDEEARTAEIQILKMADRVYRFCSSLQCELPYPLDWPLHHFLKTLAHQLPVLQVFISTDGQLLRMALAMAPLCQYFHSPWWRDQACARKMCNSGCRPSWWLSDSRYSSLPQSPPGQETSWEIDGCQ